MTGYFHFFFQQYFSFLKVASIERQATEANKHHNSPC